MPPTPIVTEPMTEPRNEVLPLDGVVWLMNDSNVTVPRWNRDVAVDTSQQERPRLATVSLPMLTALVPSNTPLNASNEHVAFSSADVLLHAGQALVKRLLATKFTGCANAGEVAAMSNAAPAAIIRSFVM